MQKANKGEVPKAKFTAKELEMAKSLVGHLTAPFKPQQFHDTYRENVERLIEQKRKSQRITAVTHYPPFASCQKAHHGTAPRRLG